MRVLRTAGPPGVGKSTVAWALAGDLATSGAAVGYVDIDQLGMRYPAPGDDPERWVLKERALAAVADVHAAAGTGTLVVSGVADPDGAPPLVPGHANAVVWLDADDDVRTGRLAERGWSGERVAETVRVGSGESSRLRAGWTRLDIGGVDVAGAVSLVQETVTAGSWSVGPAVAGVAGVQGEAAPGIGVAIETDLLWLTGPRCVGASSVGWRIAAGRWRAGTTCAFVDLAQLSFRWGPGAASGLGVAALGALLRSFGAVGASPAVVVAPLTVTPPASARVVRLDAGPDALRARAAERTAGGGPVLAGDDLVGRSGADLEAVVTRAVRDRSSPLRPGEAVVRTDDLAPEAVAEPVLRLGRGG